MYTNRTSLETVFTTRTTISDDVLIMGSTGGSYGTPRLSLRSDVTNNESGPSIDLLEGNIDFGETGSNGFR